MTTAFSDQEHLPVSYIRQYLFCPRVPWYKMVGSFEPPMPAWVEQGKRWHEKQPALQKKRQLRGLDAPFAHQANAYVASHKLGLYGYADELLANDHQVVVVEYKNDKRPPTNAQRLQLVAYLMCARDTWQGKTLWGVLYKGGGRKQYRVELAVQDVEKVCQVMSRIRHNAQQHLLPDSSAQAVQCAQCEYLRYCNDR